MENLSEKIVKFYSWIISFIAVIVIAINTWILASSLFKQVIITDEEYIAERYSYRYDICDKVEDDVEKCKAEEKEKLILQRQVNFKKDLIDAISLLTVFTILFAFHYPKFRTKK